MRQSSESRDRLDGYWFFIRAIRVIRGLSFALSVFSMAKPILQWKEPKDFDRMIRAGTPKWMLIAGPAFLEKPKVWSDSGASGTYVRTLVQLARNWK